MCVCVFRMHRNYSRWPRLGLGHGQRRTTALPPLATRHSPAPLHKEEAGLDMDKINAATAPNSKQQTHKPIEEMFYEIETETARLRDRKNNKTHRQTWRNSLASIGKNVNRFICKLS